jgi:RNA-directed DNA polymerase
MESINSWSDVNWFETNKRIYRLQVRIYKASQNDDRDKMHKLQKLLITSNSSKLLAIRKVVQEDDGFKLLSSSKRLELALSIRLEGKFTNIRRVKITKLCGEVRRLTISKLQDRAKQALACLALQPQWEAKFEFQAFGLKLERSLNDAMSAIFISISKKPKWVLAAHIDTCFDTINHKKLILKCDTFPVMERQLNDWLKSGLPDAKKCVVSPTETSHGVISPLLSSIALHGLQDRLEYYSDRLPCGKLANTSCLFYVRHAGELVIVHPDLEVIQKWREITIQFLEEMDLKLSITKTKIFHTFDNYEGPQLGFRFLSFDLIQRQKCDKTRKFTFSNTVPDQSFVTLITPSKEVVHSHKVNLREIIKKYKGVSQENLIYNLNPIIRGWALSKRNQISSKIFSEMDTFIYFHLWNWARKRHPKMAYTKIKDKYWHRIGNSNWVFGKKLDKRVKVVFILLQKHSEIKLETDLQVIEYPLSRYGNVSY